MYNIIDKGKHIERFSIYVRIAHWVNAMCIIMLFITGLPLYVEQFNPMFSWFGGADNTRFLHRVFAIIFLFPTLFVIMTDRASFYHWTKQITTWTEGDIKFLGAFPKELFGIKSTTPPQGFFNAGQKINSLLTIFAAFFMVVSGFILWFPHFFPETVVFWAYPIHNMGVGLMIAVVIGHIYLSIGDPKSRASFRGMILGSIDVKYAEKHHKLWYDEEVEKDKKKK